MKRLFFALDISGEARAKAADHAREFRERFPNVRVGWERPEKFHLTLRFLGETPGSMIKPITEAAAAAAARTAPFGIAIRGCGVFPNSRRPQTIWLGVVDDAHRTGQLKRSIDAELAKIGFGNEKRRFAPHLTIGRVREPERAAQLAAAHVAHGFDSDLFEIAAITLYESRLDHRGSVYRPLEILRLGSES